MSNVDVDLLIARVERQPDGEIIKALASPDEYTLEAMAVYEAEAKRRGIQAATVRPVALQVAQSRKDRAASTWMFKGIGERLYGKRSFRPDGSYQATKWFVFLYLPIYPICSLRLQPDSEHGPKVLEVLPIDWRQAIDTYCFVAIAWGGVALGGNFFERQAFPYHDVAGIALLGLPLLFLYLIRRRARRRVRGSKAGP